MSAELQRDFDNSEIDLIPGGGGIFEVKLDGVVVFQKQSADDFPAPGVVSEAIASAQS